MNLDDDLAVWAASVRLPDADAGAIFQRIIAAPARSAAAASATAPSVSAPSVTVPSVTVPSVTVPSAAPGLDPSWWRGFTAGFTARMVASTAPVRLAA